MIFQYGFKDLTLGESDLPFFSFFSFLFFFFFSLLDADLLSLRKADFIFPR